MISVVFVEEARVDEFFGGLDALEHPEDDNDEKSAKNEKRQVYAEGGGRVERMNCVLQ